MKKRFEYKIYQEMLIYYGTETDKEIRMHIFIDKYMRKINSFKASRHDEIVGAYFSKYQLMYLLGANNYIEYVRELTELRLITVLDKQSDFGKQLYYFAPREFMFVRIDYVPRSRKRIYQSLKHYKEHKIDGLSSTEGIVLSNLKYISTNLTDADFRNYYTDHYPTYVDECEYTNKQPIEFQDYSKQYEYIWSDFKEFVNADQGDMYEYIVVDKFGRRVHTPITRSPKYIRSALRLADFPTVSLDLKQSQPTILAKTLEDLDPENDFTLLFKHVDDIYLYIKDKLDLPDRDAAKDFFFSMVFGKPFGRNHEAFAKLFPIAAKMIKPMKINRNPENPSEKIHSNLASLMQRKEKAIFEKVWRILHDNGIKFTPCHDEVIVPTKHMDQAIDIMQYVISNELQGFQVIINITRE